MVHALLSGGYPSIFTTLQFEALSLGCTATDLTIFGLLNLRTCDPTQASYTPSWASSGGMDRLSWGPENIFAKQAIGFQSGGRTLRVYGYTTALHFTLLIHLHTQSQPPPSPLLRFRLRSHSRAFRYTLVENTKRPKTVSPTLPECLSSGLNQLY